MDPEQPADPSEPENPTDPTEPDVPTEPADPEEPTNPFEDLDSERYYYTPVLWAVANKITDGMDATHFAPMQNCTRGQVVTFLWRAVGSPEPTAAENPFTDVEEGRFYYKAVLWAVENGITTGMTETTFEPNTTVPRGQFVTFLWRLEKDPTHTESNPFTDVSDGRFYYNAVLWAAEQGITTGMTNTTFEPAGGCTRGQVVTFLYRLLAE